MDSDWGDWLWFVVDAIATGILALALLVAYRSAQERFGDSGRNRQLAREEAELQRVRRS